MKFYTLFTLHFQTIKLIKINFLFLIISPESSNWQLLESQVGSIILPRFNHSSKVQSFSQGSIIHQSSTILQRFNHCPKFQPFSKGSTILPRFNHYPKVQSFSQGSIILPRFNHSPKVQSFSKVQPFSKG